MFLLFWGLFVMNIKYYSTDDLLLLTGRLTAFAMKVLCQTSHFVEVDINATCSSLHWLRTRQNTDGSFVEDVWVTHREMLVR